MNAMSSATSETYGLLAYGRPHISEALAHKKKAFPDMGVLIKYDQIEPIYLPQRVVTYISLHTVYRVTQVSVNLKHFLILVGMFRLKPASQFVERHHGIVSCALNMKNLSSKNFCKFSK
jgi:hypothetical protein